MLDSSAFEVDKMPLHLEVRRGRQSYLNGSVGSAPQILHRRVRWSVRARCPDAFRESSIPRFHGRNSLQPGAQPIRLIAEFDSARRRALPSAATISRSVILQSKRDIQGLDSA